MFRSSRLIGVIVAALVFVVVVSPVDAGRKWCQVDPTFNIAGTLTPVDIAVYEDLQVHVNGPILVRLNVPPGTPVEVTYVDEGFNGFGEVITVVPDHHLKATGRGIQVRFEIAVPASKVMPIQATVSPASGRASTVSASTSTSITIVTTVASAG
jgi:hypothetical protein